MNEAADILVFLCVWAFLFAVFGLVYLALQNIGGGE